MVDENTVVQIARAAATANLGSAAFSSVMSEPATDSTGREALRITIVLEPDAAPKLTGDAVLDTLVQIHDDLRKVGEERFPIIEYATEAELQDSGDP